MIRRVVTLTAVGALVWILLQLGAEGTTSNPARGTLILGFMLLAAALLGEILEQLRLPRITGYIVAGIVFGPNATEFIDTGTLATLDVFNDLAYAFIGLAAGAELKLATLKGRWKSIVLLIVCTTAVVMTGVGGCFFVAASYGGFLGDLSMLQLLAVAGIVGVIAAARSPSSAIAIIRETRAKGPFSETVLGVSVAMDVVVIVLFSLAVAFGGLAFNPDQGMDFDFVISLGAEIGGSLVAGIVLGLLMVLYLKHKGPQIPLVIAGGCFLVYRLSVISGHYLEQTRGLQVHLEPLLVCAAAGFVIQNLSRHGDRLVSSMDQVALPIYVIFFTLAGARLDLEALAATWTVALVVAGLRVVMIIAGTRLASSLAADPPAYRKNFWLGFVTQAGLSLALISQLDSSSGDWGGRLATVLVAVVAINQLVGPAAFKMALERLGEARRRGGFGKGSS
jgi:Kef-type K+ transport system membrane component KefB